MSNAKYLGPLLCKSKFLKLDHKIIASYNVPLFLVSHAGILQNQSRLLT